LLGDVGICQVGSLELHIQLNIAVLEE